MKSDITTAREDLRSLAAAVLVLSQLQGNKAKGGFLIETLEKKPRLGAYLRACYDPSRLYPIKSHDATRLKGLPEVGDDVGTPLEVLRWFTENACNKHTAACEWARVLKKLDPGAADMANRVLDRDLECGVDAKLLNKVFDRLGRKLLPLTTDPPPAGIALELNSYLQGSYTCIIYHNGTRVGNGVLYESPALKRTLDEFRQNGFKVIIPKHVKAT